MRFFDLKVKNWKFGIFEGNFPDSKLADPTRAEKKWPNSTLIKSVWPWPISSFRVPNWKSVLLAIKLHNCFIYFSIYQILVIYPIFVVVLDHKIPHFSNDEMYFKYCTKYGHYFGWVHIGMLTFVEYGPTCRIPTNSLKHYSLNNWMYSTKLSDANPYPDTDPDSVLDANPNVNPDAGPVGIWRVRPFDELDLVS